MRTLSDPLAEFRTQTTQTKTPTRAGKKPYEAYDNKGRPFPYTEILCAGQPSQSPQSRFFLAAVFSADYEDAFTLIYSFMAVEIKGKRLKPVRQAVQSGRCEFIQEFDESEFLPPAKDAPVIESIRFIAGEKLEDILSAYRK